MPFWSPTASQLWGGQPIRSPKMETDWKASKPAGAAGTRATARSWVVMLLLRWFHAVWPATPPTLRSPPSAAPLLAQGSGFNPLYFRAQPSQRPGAVAGGKTRLKLGGDGFVFGKDFGRQGHRIPAPRQSRQATPGRALRLEDSTDDGVRVEDDRGHVFGTACLPLRRRRMAAWIAA